MQLQIFNSFRGKAFNSYFNKIANIMFFKNSGDKNTVRNQVNILSFFQIYGYFSHNMLSNVILVGYTGNYSSLYIVGLGHYC